MEICFNLLVDVFHFSVGLGVISSGEGKIVSKGFSKLFGKSRGKLGTSIRDDPIIKTEPGVHFMEKEGSNS